MSNASTIHAKTFRQLHAPGRLLRLANAWDAGSARLIESCGAAAAAYGVARRAAAQLLDEGRYDAMSDRLANYGELNRLFP